MYMPVTTAPIICTCNCTATAQLLHCRINVAVPNMLSSPARWK